MFNIINRRTLLAYCSDYPPAGQLLLQWYHEMYQADFKNFNELKLLYPSISLVGDDRVVFNIGGNKYRLVVRIVFEFKVIQIKWFGTHRAYDRLDVKTIQVKRK